MPREFCRYWDFGVWRNKVVLVRAVKRRTQ